MDILIQNFMKEFNMEMCARELIDLIEPSVLQEYIIEQFNSNFMYGELYDLFKEQLNTEELKELLEDMGHDFVDLEELEDDEKEKYY